MSESKTAATEYAKTYTSFGGCDIVCTFGDTIIGELQAITYHVAREKAPIYTLGSAEPRSFSRGKRGVSGSLVFTIFNRDALIEGLQDHIKADTTFQRIGENLNMEPLTIDQWDSQLTQMGPGQIGSGSVAKQADKVTTLVAKKADIVYADEIPPFDITISFANEYGQRARLVLYGVEILNEASGFSIDNVTSEKACSFVARKVEYMKPVTSTGADATSSTN